MSENVKTTLMGYINYRGRGHLAFLMHRISGVATFLFLVLHILTTATVFFVPQWYDVLVQMFRNPLIMFIEIILAFFVVYHGVNGLRIAYLDLFRPDLWRKNTTHYAIGSVFVVSTVLWLPAFFILGYSLLKHGFGLFGG